MRGSGLSASPCRSSRRRRAPLPAAVAALLLAAPWAHAQAAPRAAPPEKLGAVDGGVLWRFGAQRVLVVRGTPRAMGRAHGKLLRKEVAQDVQAFLYDWALGARGRTREELAAIWRRLAPHIPTRYKEELAGLAEGSGVPLEDLELLHAIPSRYHCTGTAALPEVTRDGKIYHTRSLDYALDIGERVRPQTNAILLVSVPENGIPHAVVTWAGFIGCVTGMNARGVSVGEMGSRSSDESFDGVPMILLLREVLWRAENLEQAKEIWRKGPRTCGFNFIFCDPRGACAVEVSRSRIRFFSAGDPAEAIAPHTAIPGILRRCNHFVDPELAATQRSPYDPRRSAAASFMAYDHQGRFLAARRGRIDAETMIALLRTYPASHPCLHQAVLCPSDLTLYVSQATDPRTDPLAGAQNQDFYRYDLPSFLAEGRPPAPAEVFSTDGSVLKPGGAQARGESNAIETGTVRGERPIEGPFAHAPEPFAWRLRRLRRVGDVKIYKLTFPSPGPSLAPEDETVVCEYYLPAGPTGRAAREPRSPGRAGTRGRRRLPAAVVLHIADGRFYVARLLATALARKGVAALFVQLPYYGDRRPRKIDASKAMAEIGILDAIGAIRQAVRDVRRAGAWLRERPEVDAGRIGIVGVSLGAFVAELAAGVDGGFSPCVFVLGGGSIAETLFSGAREVRRVRELLERRGRTREEVARLLAPYEPIANLRGLRRARILMINCRGDEVVPPASTRRYWEALGKPPIVWYEGTHYALKAHIFEVVNRVLAELSSEGARGTGTAPSGVPGARSTGSGPNGNPTPGAARKAG